MLTHIMTTYAELREDRDCLLTSTQTEPSNNYNTNDLCAAIKII